MNRCIGKLVDSSTHHSSTEYEKHLPPMSLLTQTSSCTHMPLWFGIFQCVCAWVCVCACVCVSPIYTQRWFPHSLSLIGFGLIQINWGLDLNGKHYSLLCGTVEDSLTISTLNCIKALTHPLPPSLSLPLPLCLSVCLSLSLPRLRSDWQVCINKREIFFIKISVFAKSSMQI